MKLTLALLALLLLPVVAAADLVTLTTGDTVAGTVVLVDETRVVIENEIGRQELKRAAVRTIELGRVLRTGVEGNVYTSNLFRGRFRAPEGWTMTVEPGLDFAAKKGPWIALARSMPLDGITDGGDTLLNQALESMTANIPGATTGEPRAVSWAGQSATRVDVTSKQMNLALCFLHLEHSIVLFGVGTLPERFPERDAVLAEWEKGFELIPW